MNKPTVVIGIVIPDCLVGGTEEQVARVVIAQLEVLGFPTLFDEA